MKKIVTVLTFTSLVFACTHKATPTTSIPNAETTSSTTTTTTTSSASSNTALIEQGHAVYLDKSKCARCHAPKDATAYTQERWTGILRSMVPKAKLDETETAQVTAYVMANAKK